MKRIFSLSLQAIVLSLLLVAGVAEAQAPAANVEAGRAQPDEIVWVIFNEVKAEKRQTFEHFLHETFWPMGARLGQTDEVVRRMFAQARILHPKAANKDGTYTYAFIVDPLVEGADYGILSLLKKGFEPSEAERHYQEGIESTFVGPQQSVRFRQASREVPVRAAENETVWAIYYFVKPEKREQYERFLHEVFWPAGARIGENDPEVKRVFEQTRILHPVEANEDGTWTYAFIIDPVVEGADYRILNLLKKGYGEAEGERIFREQFRDALSERPFEVREFVQSAQ